MHEISRNSERWCQQHYDSIGGGRWKEYQGGKEARVDETRQMWWTNQLGYMERLDGVSKGENLRRHSQNAGLGCITERLGGIQWHRVDELLAKQAVAVRPLKVSERAFSQQRGLACICPDLS